MHYLLWRNAPLPFAGQAQLRQRKLENFKLTSNLSLLTEITCQLSVENAMAKRAAETTAQMAAKHNVTALQKAIFLFICLNNHTSLALSQ